MANYNLRYGAPATVHLELAAKLLRDATNYLMDEGEQQRGLHLTYGPQVGGTFYREQLTKFLTKSYQQTVSSESLILTAGATNGLHLVTSMYFKTGSHVFVEDPTYWLAIDLLDDNLGMNIVPVRSTDEGVNLEEFDRMMTEKLSGVPASTERYPYRCMIYLGTVFSNPTSRSLSPERCEMLVKLARKHDALVFTEDVYNGLHYDVTNPPPPRLFSYDKPTDPEYKGSVVSNGTFSKILCPGVRVGWLEACQKMVARFHKSGMLLSGGAVSHFASQVVAAALEAGLLQKHLDDLLPVLAGRMKSAINTLGEHLPSGCTYTKPKGGYFIWITIPDGADTAVVAEDARVKYGVHVLSGARFSPSGASKNCFRISIAQIEEAEVIVGTELLCRAVSEYLDEKPWRQTDPSAQEDLSPQFDELADTKKEL